MLVDLTYFKKSGKYYGHGEFNTSKESSASEIYDIVRLLRDSRKLPGLIEGHDFYIVYVMEITLDRYYYPYLIT